MATLIIERRSEYQNRGRNYRIYVDGTNIGEVSNGRRKTFEVAPGKHEIVCKIDWCSSPTISIELMNDEIKTIEVGGFKGGNLLWGLFIAILAVHFFLRFAFDINYGFWFAIPVLLIGLYYVTFGRKKYLTLTEI